MEQDYSEPGWRYHIAISDDGKEAVKFSIQKDKGEFVGYLTAYKVNGNEISKVSDDSYTINASYIQAAYDSSSAMPTWSLAISNMNKHGKTLVALSYFPTKEITYKTSSDLESGSSQGYGTYVLVMDLNNPDKWLRIETPLDEFAGVVNFVSDPNSDMWLLTISKIEGIFHYNIDPYHTKPYKPLNETTVWQRDTPKVYSHNMKDKWKDPAIDSNVCFQFFASTIKSYVYFEPEPKKKILRVYNLRDGWHLFDLHHQGDPSLIVFGTRVLAISKNGALLAVSLDTTSINIYLMENGLECGRKETSKSHRIVLIEFINNDECLLIIRETKETYELVATVWELFTCRPDRTIEQINLPKDFYKRPTLYGIRWAGNTAIFVTNEGELKSVLDPFEPEEEKISDTPIVADKKLEYSNVYELNGNTHHLPESKFEQLIIRRIEPWISDGNNIIGLWLDGNEEKSRRQLLIGKGSIQIWKRLPDGYRLLLYIYAFKIKAKPREVTITVYKNGFDLKIELDDDDLLIKWPVDPSKSVIDACKALEWLDEEKDKNYGQFERRVLFDEIKHQVTNIVRIFIKYHPDEWRLLEVRHDLMKSLIIGGCSRLTQDLVRVSDDENNEDEKDRLALHIPRKYSWHNDNGTLKEKKTDIMVAIEKRDKLTENFLAYYAHHAKDHYSWMHTMGQALLALSESSKRSNLDINRKRLFAHPTFAGDISHGHKHFPASYTTNFRLLPEINYNLRSLILTEDDIMLIANLRQTYMIVKGTLRFKLWVRQLKRRLRNVKLGMIVKVMLTPFSFALKMIEHAVDRVSSRVHEIRRFPVPVDVDVVVRILRNAVAEGGSEIFSEHPFFTGLINNAWEETSHFYFVFLILFFSYLIAFDIFIWEFIHQNNSHYALVIYLFVIGTYYALFELNELRYHKRKSRTFYKIVNVILPIITTAVLTSRATRDDNGAWGFSQTEIGRGIIFLISISTFIMWFQLLMLLRLFEETILRILPFLVSLFILVVAFGHAMYVLLHDPTQIGLSPNLLQLGVNMTTPDGGVEHTNYTVYQNYNPQDVSDNSFASFWTSVLSSYNWMNGRWDNVDWNYYPVTIFTVIASLLLVIIMLNILIAIMGDVYDDAKVFGKREFLRLRARFVLYADDFGNMLWSALFRSYKSSSRFEEVVKKNPRYMYVLGNRRQFEQWVEERGIFREFTKPQDVQEKLTDHSCFNLEDNDHWNAFTFENSDRYRNILN